MSSLVKKKRERERKKKRKVKKPKYHFLPPVLLRLILKDS